MKTPPIPFYRRFRLLSLAVTTILMVLTGIILADEIGQPPQSHRESFGITVDLDIDSDNNNGNKAPDCSATEELMEENSPGKIIFVNHNDDDADGIPDYADLEVKGDLDERQEANFVPLLLDIQATMPNFTWDKNAGDIKIRFNYDGDATLPAMTGRDIGLGFKDYSDVKKGKGTMRLWMVATPATTRTETNYIQPGRDYTATELAYTGDKKTFYIEGINAKDDSDITVTVSYQGISYTDKVRTTVVEPDLWVNNSNSSTTLNPGTSDAEFTEDPMDEALEHQRDGFSFWWCFKKEKELGTDLGEEYQELVNLAPLKVRVPVKLRQVGWKPKLTVEVVENATSKKENLNKVYIYQSTVPDHAIGADVDRLGFFKGDMTDAKDANHLYRIAGFGIPADPTRTGYNPKNPVSVIPDNTSPAANITAMNPLVLTNGNPCDLTFTGDKAEKELLFKVVGQHEVKLRMVLSMSEPNATTNDNDIPVDSCVVTVRPPESYWSLYSARDLIQVQESRQIPVDGGFSTVKIFPKATYVPLDGMAIGVMPQGAQRPLDWTTNRKKVLVHMHGYWSPPEVVQNGNNDYFKRLYWLGYRGHFVGFMWYSNEGESIIPGIPCEFDPNILNAFKSAPRLAEFLAGDEIKLLTGGALTANSQVIGGIAVNSSPSIHTDKELQLIRGGALASGQATGGQVSNLDISAHSLGNLITFEALRLHERLHPNQFLVNNVMSIEPAVWRESFDTRDNVTYTKAGTNDGRFKAGTGFWGNDASIEYTPEQLQKMSWSFWFRQNDGIKDYCISNTFQGTLHQNYNSKDFALSYAMRANDHFRATRGFGIGYITHYTRGNSEPRCISDDNVDDTMQWVPVLMDFRENPFSSHTNLALPCGATKMYNLAHEFTPDRISKLVTIDSSPDSLIGQETLWPGSTSLLDKAFERTSKLADQSHDAFRQVPYPRILAWYERFFIKGKRAALQMGQDH